MLTIDSDGMLAGDKRIQAQRYPAIEHGSLAQVRAFVVHQTDSSTDQSAFHSYGKGLDGAHFLIGKAGTIYQTASVNSVCYHVGRYIKSKCLEVNKSACSDQAAVKLLALKWSAQKIAVDTHERAKAYPDRYPLNSDALGVEIVGKSIDAKTYEAVSAAQNASLGWLLGELFLVFTLGKTDVYRHPEVSYKNPGEAAGATW